MSIDDEGASPKERLIGACRRNNEELLKDVLASAGRVEVDGDSEITPEEQAIANLINTTWDSTGEHSLHIAALNGSYEALDLITEQAEVEMDPRARQDGAYPLHRAVTYSNNMLIEADQSSSPLYDAMKLGSAVVKLLLQAGCDPRLQNKGGRKAIEALDVRHHKVRKRLLKAEFEMVKSSDVIDEDNRSEGGDGPPSDED